MTHEIILKEHLIKITKDYRELLDAHLNLIDKYRHLELINTDLNNKVVMLQFTPEIFVKKELKGGD